MSISDLISRKTYPFLSLHLSLVLIGASSLSAQQPEPAEPAAKPTVATFSGEATTTAILKVANAVANWQLAHPYQEENWDWTEGALWTGLAAHAQTTGNQTYYDALLNVSNELNYQLGPRPEFADDHCVGQLHLWNYLRDELPHQLAPTRKTMTRFIARPHQEPLLWVNSIHLREWAWCDSLYMSPPTLAMLYTATGEPRYLTKMDKLWWRTSDYLYDPQAHLYTRDSTYFHKKEKNGAKVFWSRGNGWVFAGLCNILRNMPQDYPNRAKFEQRFREMAEKLKSIQQADGSWHASLLDPESFPVPESSGTAFFTYGFLWGINHGILPEQQYLPAALKGWKRLVSNVHPDGMLGYVQPIGADPRSVGYQQTAVYGVGGFLLAAHELHKHTILSHAKSATISISNPSDFNRLNAIVSIDWKKITRILPSATSSNIACRDTQSGYFLTTQIIDANHDGTPEKLLVQTHLLPKQKRSLQLLACGDDKPNFRKNQLEARFVPERKDDFAWENDRIAFRAYGPALAVENARGGIDVWTKSVRTPIINLWYSKGSAHYHHDNGTGLDGYKVGSSLGCGGLGYLNAKGKLITSPVFKTYEVLEKGPLRLKFRLIYPEITIDKAKISETRTITMHAGSHAFEVVSNFAITGDATGIRPVAGLVIRNPKDKPSLFTGQFFAYSDPIMAKEHGNIATFIINDNSAKNRYKRTDSHLLKILADDLSRPVHYHAGAIWQKIEATTPEQLELHIYRLHSKIIQPINY